MPRYQIIAPDGREIVIEGDRPPNQEDALKIFAQLPPKPERRQLATSQLDKDRELLRTEAGRKELEARAAAGEPKARGNIGLLADIGLEGGGAVGGQLVGSLAGPIGTSVGGAAGGVLGNIASQKRRILMGEQEGYRPGEMFSSALTGAIPGAPLAARGVGSIVREAVKQGAGGLAGKTVETVVDESRLPGAREVAITTLLPAVAGGGAQRRQLANPEIEAAVTRAATGPGSTRRATLAAGQEAGYLVPPSDVNPSFINKRLESIAGPADIRRGAAASNQKVTNRLAAADLGLPEGTELTRPVLREVREQAARPYGELAAVSPEAAVDLQALRDARDRANVYRRDYNQNAHPESLRIAQEAEILADTLEGNLEAAAVAAGRPELVDAMRAGRTRIAKSYDVERALNVGDSGVSAPVLGRAIDKGKPLTGGLATIANFAEAFPRAVPEGAVAHPVNLSRTEMLTGGLLGAGGYLSTGNPYYALAGLAPSISSDLSRRLVLSRPYQALVANMPPPRVDATPDARAMTGRVLAQEAAQEIAEEAKKDETPPAKTEEKPAEPPPKKSAMVQPPDEEDLPTLTPRQAKKAPVGTKFIGTNGLAYEKKANGKIEQLA